MKYPHALKALCLLLAALVCMTTIPVLSFAAPICPDSVNDVDMQKLYAFWQQPAYDGMNNGEATYDFELPEGCYSLWNADYSGSWATDLVTQTVVGHSSGFYFRFSYLFRYTIPSINGSPSGEGILQVTPDLYGDLDLSDTEVIEFGSAYSSNNFPAPNQTHITSVLLDNCEKLERVDFNGQNYCTEFSALYCPALEHLQLLNGAFNSIAFDFKNCGNALKAQAFGAGSVGAEYESDAARLFAYPEKDAFLGWFIDGKRISTEFEIAVSEAGELIACFGGDANDDGCISIADAVIVLRTAMGESNPQNVNALDVDSNGIISVADAIMIARFALGL